MDPRYHQLAKLLVHHSIRVREGDKVLIEATAIPGAMLCALSQAVTEAGGIPIFNLSDTEILRQFLRNPDTEALRRACQSVGELEAERMRHMDCYIGLRGMLNAAAMADVPPENMAIYQKYWMQPVHSKLRVPNTRWVVLRWPTSALAQLADMSDEAFRDYFFQVCLTDYQAMEKAVQPLQELMARTDRVEIKGPGTDLRFSMQGIGSLACFGLRNLPDGECYSAPVRDSVEGEISFNTLTNYRGVRMQDVYLKFSRGKVVEARSSHSAALNTLLDTDEGARYVGEFALGFNPYITRAIGDTIFDEKMRGSLHLALGNCYQAADNGNHSAIHWDLVLSQEAGGEIYFDGQLIRQNGLFVPSQLQQLNPQALTNRL